MLTKKGESMEISTCNVHARSFIYSALIALCSYSLIAAFNEREFIDKYKVEPDVQEILDAHSHEIADKLDKVHRQGITNHTTWKFRWLPGYYVKFNLDRIY